LALSEKNPYEITAIQNGHHLSADQARKLLTGLSRSGGDRLSRFEKAGHSLDTDKFQSGFLGWDIVVKARLADVQDVGDILRGRAVVAALGKDLGRRLDDFDRPAVRSSL